MYLCLSCRGTPASGHQAGFRPRQAAPEQPVAVQLNKMPAQAEAGKKKGRHKGSGRNKRSKNFYKMCREFEQKGHCTIVDCDFAHGQDNLDVRIREKE